jgi:glycosyltransferase involved in cell wall biosynthesis
MAMQPKVSVVIPFYNCAYVNQAIESALNQTYPNVEVIVVNDGSTRHAEKIRPYLRHIRYIEKANGGTATALNTGILNATGQFFAWLSSDDLYVPHKIARQLSFMQESGAWASFTPFRAIDANNRFIRQFPTIYLQNRIHFFELMKHQCLINGGTVMFRMELFRQVGLFDERYRYAHDYEFWLRVLLHHHFAFLNEPLLLYRLHTEMGTHQHAKEVALEAARVQQRYMNVRIG